MTHAPPSEAHKIVVGTDFSECSYPALHEAARVARREGGTVFLAHVIDPLPYAGPGIDSILGTETLREGLEEYGKQHLEELRNTHFEGVAVEQHLIWSPAAAQAIADLAERVDADLVVVGTHGRTGMKRLMMGSVAEKIARVAPCSVLIVRE